MSSYILAIKKVFINLFRNNVCISY